MPTHSEMHDAVQSNLTRAPTLDRRTLLGGAAALAATALAAPETDPSQLLATADAALYRAKHMGRNRISLPREG